ncbi:hypothetical protein KP509_39G010700 [Ceratopteris richardii]|nr:hypothetical protein KP509_39G010700 [Ceratopteris richardii]
MRYWHWASQPDSWFPESAVLDRVCWFEVAGEFESMFLPGTYTVSFRVKLRVDPGRSWSRAPVKFYLSANNGQNVEVQRFFDDRKNGEITNLARLRRLPSYPWMELDIGEFVVDKEMHVALKYQMMEIEGGQWKSGIIVDCLKIQPSSAIRGVAEGAT